uniref:Eukaryotic translation initiation factor 4B n=1 Tax=Gorilla gorilla gorilla TaxID=9595 RepID=A0A2I2YRX4_GORGO
TLSLTDSLAEDGGTGGGSIYVSKPVSWAHETDDLEGDISTTWNSNDEDVYRAPPIDRSILPTAPGAAWEPNIDWSHLPKLSPYIAFLGNLPYDVTEECIKEFFRGLSISAVLLPREPSNPEKLKGFGYAEFEDLDSLLSALSLNEESLVDVADQAQDKDRNDRSSGCDRNYSFDDYSPRRGDDSFGDKYRDHYDSDWYCDEYWDGPRSRDYDRGYDSQIGNGRKAFGSGYHRDDDYRGGGDYDYSWDDYRRDDRGPPQRPKLNLKPQSTPKEDDSSASTSQSSQAASIFGGTKPIDTAAREREVEQLQKEQEKLQHQLDEPKLERWPRERHPSWQSEETQEQERLRTGSESSQTGASATSGRNKSLENETLNKEEDCHSPTSKTPKPDQPLKVMPAPPPKENAWVKYRAAIPTSGGGKVAPAQPSEEGTARKDENKVDGMNVPKGQTGNSSHGPGDRGNKDHWTESDRKDGQKDQESRSAPKPYKPKENLASKFSSASKYAAVSVDGENENEGEDYTK